jgi:hypothetical protein
MDFTADTPVLQYLQLAACYQEMMPSQRYSNINSHDDCAITNQEMMLASSLESKQGDGCIYFFSCA